MKKITFLLFLFLPAITFSQVFNTPESVEYDSANSRWLVGQAGSHVVLSYDPSSGTLHNFCSGLSSGPHGIEVVGNVLYCCDGGSIKGFNLSNGSQVFNLNLGASFLNGLTSDGGNFLFATDFSGKKIFRVDIASTVYNLMTTTVKTPNGIIYDGANNRCVFVTWGSSNAAVQAMSLLDSTVSTLKATTLSNFDGIIRDPQGNWYVSSWGNSSLNKFDPAFTSNSVVVMGSLSSPADLGINSAGDSIGIPNSISPGNVVFYHIPVTGIEPVTDRNKIQLFPNPSDNKATILLEEPVVNGTLELSDINGRIVKGQTVSGYVFLLDRGTLPAGNYIVVVKDQNEKIIHVQKLIYR